jgi:hypothetical protein
VDQVAHGERWCSAIFDDHHKFTRVVYGMAITELPDKLKPIPGVASYYVISYTSRQALNDGLTVGGELLVARVESGITKNYQYGFATSSGGAPYFVGPYKVSVGTMCTVGKAFP